MIKIIGDSERRKVYDPAVIDRLVAQHEAEQAEKKKRALLGEEQASDKDIALDSHIFGYLDKSPLLDNDGKPFCSIKSDLEAKFAQAGKEMATAADYYAAAKTGNQLLFRELRKDFKLDGIVCGGYMKISRSTHNAWIYRKESAKNISDLTKNIPLPDCSAGIELLTFPKWADKKPDIIHSLFGTKDDIVEIAMTLETLTGTTLFNTKIFTPPPHFVMRRGKPLFYGVELQLCNDEFHINLLHEVCAKGRAHAVYFK